MKYSIAIIVAVLIMFGFSINYGVEQFTQPSKYYSPVEGELEYKEAYKEITKQYNMNNPEERAKAYKELKPYLDTYYQGTKKWEEQNTK